MLAVFAMQVLRLCWRYGLLTALTYILNRGLNDYMGPAAHLLMALLRPSAHGPASDSKAAGYRLLVYLRCCLTGCSFPPGAQAMLTLVISDVSSAAGPFHGSAFPVCLLYQLLHMLAVWCCREVVLIAGRSCLGVQSTKLGDLTCTLLVQQQLCKQTSQMHGRDCQLVLYCVSVGKDKDRSHVMQVVVACLKQ
jgi:hypothetical protein